MIQSKRDFQSFKEACERAKKMGDGIFKFKKQEVLVSYAKYIIEYVETQRKDLL
jgi:hypothetical protein